VASASAGVNGLPSRMATKERCVPIGKSVAGSRHRLD
jgi:hypothetical protein